MKIGEDSEEEESSRGIKENRRNGGNEVKMRRCVEETTRKGVEEKTKQVEEEKKTKG